MAAACENHKSSKVQSTSESSIEIPNGFRPITPKMGINFEKLPELKLDAKQAQAFLSFFKTLPNDPRAVRFFDRRDYYTTHGENANFIAKTYYHTTTAVHQLGSGSEAIYSVSVSKNMFEIVARDLLLERTDHTLELYEGSGENWRLVKKGTPGNLDSFEGILFSNNEMQDSPVIVAIFAILSANGCNVGLSYVDLTKRVLGLTEFPDDGHFTNVESTLVALGCKECLLPLEIAKSSEYRSLTYALSRCGAMVTEIKKTEFKGRDLVQDLGRLLKGSIDSVRDMLAAFELAPEALGCILSYTDILGDESNHGNYKIQRYNLDSYMRLDSAAMRALNVMKSRMDANKNLSLFGLLNRTCTAGMGKRLLHMWLKQPLVDVDEINCRLDLVQTFVEDNALRQDLRQHLKRISDIEMLMRSLEKKRASLVHVVKLYQSSIRLPFIKSALEKYNGQFDSMIKERYLDPLDKWTDHNHLNKFIGLVEAAIDLNQLENGEYLISSGYDSRLLALKNAKKKLEHQIHDVYKKAATDLDLVLDKTLKLEKGTQYGYAFRITKKKEPTVREKLNTQFIVLETPKDWVKFTNTELKILSGFYQNVLDNYKNCQKELVARVVQTAASFSELFEGLANLLSELDVLLSFADLAASCPTPYTRPIITPSDVGDIILKGSRHPCVEAQDWVNFIPNDCELVRGKSWFQIITGPNMGGKSTFTRQVGVTILMAQVGAFVPCDNACISIRDCIFARVGAGDCQLRGVSTFMQEMLETASILKRATKRSLIIIDELGRGTSTYDGFGLAWAICVHIVEVIEAPTLFVTHFHELTALAHENASNEQPLKTLVGVANYHVSAHIDSSSRLLTMLYKVKAGAFDQSFGIHVAEFAEFPECVVALARAKASELEDFSLMAFGPEEIGYKRKREDLDDESRSAERGRQFVKDFFELPQDKMEVMQALHHVNLDDVCRGAETVRQFLKEFSELPLDMMELNQVLHHVRKLKEDLQKDAVHSCWLQQFLQ